MSTFSHKQNSPPKVITAISPKGGATKTTVITNLAGLLADLGYKVLIIDSDIQRSVSRQFLNLTAEHDNLGSATASPITGLGEILYRGGIVHQEDIRSSFRPNIDVIIGNIGDEHISWLKERSDAFSVFIRCT